MIGNYDVDNEKISINDKYFKTRGAPPEFPIITDYPNNIMVEVTNACNLKCKFCYHKDMKRKVGFMEEGLYQKVIDEAKSLGVSNLALYTTGESFLHQKLFEFIKYAKDAGIKYVYLTTNGQLLDDGKIEKIFQSGLDSIKFSVDMASKQSYESFKIGASWKILNDNIKKIRELRDKKGSKLKIFGSFVIMENNYKDLKQYLKIFKEFDENLFGIVCDQGGNMKIDLMRPSSLLLHERELFLSKEKWHPCNYLWNRFVVTYDGKLTICCVDFEAQLVYGDLTKQSLQECWNNTTMQNYRKNHKNGNFKLMPQCFVCENIKKDFVAEDLLVKHLVEEAGYSD